MTSNGSKSSSRSKAPAYDASNSGSHAVHPEKDAVAALASGTATPPGLSDPGGGTFAESKVRRRGSIFAGDPVDLEQQFAKAYPKSYAFLKPLERFFGHGGEIPVFVITSSVEGFRRAGYTFSAEARYISMSEFDRPEQLEALLSATELTVEMR